TTLVFDYTVASPAKSLDLDYASTASLTGGTIKDSVGNDANRTLPTTGSANSIGGSKNIEIAGDSSIPVLSASTSATNAFVTSAITPVNVNNSTGNDLTNDGRTITYSCFFDNTVNSAMDSGGTACSSLANSTFNSSTGVFSWAPTATQQAAYDTAKNYEFLITGSSPANVSGTVYFTVKVIRPFATSIPYDALSGSSYTYDSSLIDFSGGTVKLSNKDHDDDQYNSNWGGGSSGALRYNNPYWILMLGAAGFCPGFATNCAFSGDGPWVPKLSNRVKAEGFEGTVPFGLTHPDPTGPNVPQKDGGAWKAWYSSVRFDGNDWLESPNTIVDSFTTNIWIKTTQSVVEGPCSLFTQGTGIISTEMVGITNDWGISLCDGYIIAGTGNSTSGLEKAIKSARRYNDNVWHMVTFSRDKTSGVLKLYVDGVLQGSDTNGSNQLNASGTIYFGTHKNDTLNFLGNMDELVLWNAALTDTEVLNFYERQSPAKVGLYESRIMDAGYTNAPWTGIAVATNVPAGKELPDSAASESSSSYGTFAGNLMVGIKALWHLNETAGSYPDRSGSGADATVIGITAGAPGRLGKAIYLNGTNQSLNLGNNAAISFGAGSFSSSFWVRNNKTYGAGAAGRIFSNGLWGSSNGWMVRVLDKYINFGIGCANQGAANCVQIRGSYPINDNKWHHVMTVTDRTAGLVKLFVDGVQDTPVQIADGSCGTLSGKDLNISGCAQLNANRSISYNYLGGHDNSSEFYEGSIDEVAIWGRALSESEVYSVFRRVATRFLVQVKTCTTSNCSDDPTNTAWKGPDGTNQTFFSELNNNTSPSSQGGTVKTTSLQINFADYGLTFTGRYFQYKVLLDSEDNVGKCDYGGGAAPCSPEIRSVTVTPEHYAVSPSIVYNTAIPFYTINTLYETLGGQSCSEGIKYQLSINNSNWYYHNGTTWVASNGSYSQSNTLAYLNTKAADFSSIVGRGNLYVKTFLGSSGTSQCEMDKLELGGNLSY
ncbi:MAG: hypothetical protein EOP14_03600, partial [Pseudomonas sp.]